MSNLYIKAVELNGVDQYQLLDGDTVVAQCGTLQAILAAWRLLCPDSAPTFSDS